MEEQWADGITSIVAADLGPSPAAINRETGVMYVNPDFKLSEDQWYFIMLHELGHLKAKTQDELRADQWAHEQYLKEGRSLKQSVYALTDLLSFNKPEDFLRTQNQLARAQVKDGKKKNITAAPAATSQGNQTRKTMSYTRTYLPYGWNPCEEKYKEYYTGTNRKVFGFSLDDLVNDAKSIGSIVGNITGGSKPGATAASGGGTDLTSMLIMQQQQAAANAQAAAAQQSSSRTMILVGAGIAAMVVIGIILALVLKK